MIQNTRNMTRFLMKFMERFSQPSLFRFWKSKNLKIAPSELVLKVDLNYTKDEIMSAVEGFIKQAVDEYQSGRVKRFKKNIRKNGHNTL